MSKKKNDNINCEIDLLDEITNFSNEKELLEAEIIRTHELTNLASGLLEELENEFKD